MPLTILLRKCGLLVAVLVSFAGMATAAEPEDVTFIADFDKTEQRYVLVTPDVIPAAGVDVLIILHGHGRDRWQFVREQFPAARAVQDFVRKHQVVCVSPDYRAKTSWMGPAAEADTVQIIQRIKQQFRVNRLFIAGGSMGGSSALTFTALHPELISGVAAMNGTANHVLYTNYQDAIAASFGGTPAEVPEEYKRRSAEYWPERFTMPVSLTTGGRDLSVPPDSVLRLAAALGRMNRPHLLLHRAEGGHSTTYDDALQMLEFLLKAK